MASCEEEKVFLPSLTRLRQEELVLVSTARFGGERETKDRRTRESQRDLAGEAFPCLSVQSARLWGIVL
jgi:hypothetical protein